MPGVAGPRQGQVKVKVRRARRGIARRIKFAGYTLDEAHYKWALATR